MSPSIVADFSFGFETHANAAPGIAGEIHPDMIRFLLSVGYLSEILEGINLNPSLLIRVVVPTEESGSLDVNVGLAFVTSLCIVRD